MRRLVWKLYGLGFVQLVLLGLTVVGVGWLLHDADHGPPPMPAAPEVREGPELHHEHGPHRPPSPVAPLLTFLVSGLIIVGTGSLLTARWLVRPLENLSRAARALGQGDLNARAAVARDDEVGEVAAAFDDMASRVQQLLVAERELLANVSHELRTPLARVRVALDILAESSIDPGGVRLDEVGSDLSEIETIIDDVLTAARLDVEVGRLGPAGFALRLERVDPRTVCRDAAERFAARHRARPLEVTLSDDVVPVKADPSFLRRVLDNLLQNAHKYSPDPAAAITLGATKEGERVVLTVADRGAGIAPEDLPRVFEPFFRGDRSRSRAAGGVGLGLTLARRIVDALGGTIEVASVLGQGTTVRVLLSPA